VRRALLVAALVGVVAAVVVTWPGGPGAETATDLGAAVGIAGDPPFAIRLGGPLWRDRTIKDGEGTPDAALIAGDEPLAATIRGSRLAAVELRVDGRVQQRLRRRCRPSRCPVTLRVRLRPRLDARQGGDRRVEVIARSASGARSVASLSVRVAPDLPVVREAAPGPPPPPRATLPAGPRRAALSLLAAERRGGGLHALLGAAGLQVRAAGTLRAGRTPIGVTLWLTLARPRRDVAATVPGYRPAGSAYVPRLVSLRVESLADVLVDVDLRSRRVISVEPGPASVTTGWSPSDVPPPQGFAGAARTPQLVQASESGPAFLSYDGSPALDPRLSDWPVSLVFAGHANVDKVKDALRRLGLTHRGLPHYLAYRRPGAGVRFDGDRGLKTACDRAGTDVHLRLYAPAEVDHFTDPELGSFVVATTHLDQHDTCATGAPRFGFSEAAEQRIGGLARRLGWVVQPDRLALGNAEPYRRDIRDPGHLWFGDGRATVIWVP
jgi:hypothetical protein